MHSQCSIHQIVADNSLVRHADIRIINQLRIIEQLMPAVSLDEYESRWADVEDAVDATPDVDPWCSGPDWTAPVHRAFAPKQKHSAFEYDLIFEYERAGFASLAPYVTENGTCYLSGLEPLWGFASPLVGQDTAAVATNLCPDLEKLDHWMALYLPGLPASSCDTDQTDTEEIVVSPTSVEIARSLSELGELRWHPGIVRQVANLEDGYESWWQRRSAKFRRNLSKAHATANQHRVSFADVSEDSDVFDRLMKIELRSWKGLTDSGISAPEMSVMYQLMIHRLQAKSRLHVYIAVVDGLDRGFILGGVRGRRYRGLQLSFDDEFASLGLGNLLQRHQLEQLCNSGSVDVYDMGMDFPYKRRWADSAERSVAVVVHRQ